MKRIRLTLAARDFAVISQFLIARGVGFLAEPIDIDAERARSLATPPRRKGANGQDARAVRGEVKTANGGKPGPEWLRLAVTARPTATGSGLFPRGEAAE